MTSIGRAGARVGFGNTRQLAEEKVLGRAARGDQNEGTFNPSKNTGHVSASPADYADALSKGHTVIPLLSVLRDLWWLLPGGYAPPSPTAGPGV